MLRTVLTSSQRYYLDFLLAMTEKEIKARYKFAVLGFLWIILNPLLQMLVIGFVFQFFVPVKVDNYFLFLFTGLLPWNFFAMTVLKTTPAIINERALIQKAKFPRESIVLSIVLSNLFHFLIALSLLMVVLVGDKVLFERYSAWQILQYSGEMLLIFPVIVLLLLLTSGMSLLLSALDVRYRDVNFAIQAFMPLWLYATPVFYTLNLLPAELSKFFYLNPMTVIIELFHLIFLKQPLTDPLLAGVSLISTALIVVVGWKYFSSQSKTFDDWI